MRRIKFRGVDCRSGIPVCGSFDNIKTDPFNHRYYVVTMDGRDYQVRIEDLKQLIGVDRNGLEVHEDSMVMRDDSKWAFPASFEDYAGIRDEEIYLARS